MDMSLREGAGRVALSDLCEERTLAPGASAGVETKPTKQSPTHEEMASLAKPVLSLSKGTPSQ